MIATSGPSRPRGLEMMRTGAFTDAALTVLAPVSSRAHTLATRPS